MAKKKEPEVEIINLMEAIRDLAKERGISEDEIFGAIEDGIVAAFKREFGGANKIMAALKEAGAPFEMRTVVLGHLMRGGTPAPFDRIFATKLGCHAIDVLHEGKTDVMVGLVHGSLAESPLEEVVHSKECKAGSEEALMSLAARTSKLIDRLSV